LLPLTSGELNILPDHPRPATRMRMRSSRKPSPGERLQLCSLVDELASNARLDGVKLSTPPFERASGLLRKTKCFIKASESLERVGLRSRLEFVEGHNVKSELDGCNFVGAIKKPEHDLNDERDNLMRVFKFVYVIGDIYWYERTFCFRLSAGP
jgi:hypothetical protein